MQEFTTMNLDKEEMRRLARYEETFEAYAEDLGPEFRYRLYCEDIYPVTVEDLHEALLNMREKEPDMKELFFFWFAPMDELSESFGLENAFEFGAFEEADGRMPIGLSVTEEQVKVEVITALFKACMTFLDPDTVSDMSFLDECIELTECYLSERDKPLLERRYSRAQKKNLIRAYMNNGRINAADDAVLELLKRFMDELIPEDDEDAMQLKSLCCVYGNALYGRDLDTACRLTERLYENTGEAAHALKLARLIMMGSEGETDQGRAKAFGLLAVAAANGISEGRLALADMYRNGYGCRKSLTTARHLYREVYDDAFRTTVTDKFFPYWFSMAALRMFDVYAFGIGAERDMRAAYYFLLQAKYAADTSIQNTEVFSMTAVEEEIQQRAESISREAYEILCPAEGYRSGDPAILREMIRQAGAVFLDVTDTGNGEAAIVAVAQEKVLITIPESSFCQFTDEIKIETAGLRSSIEVNDDHPLRVDKVTVDGMTDQIMLWNGGEIVGWMYCREFRVR